MIEAEAPNLHKLILTLNENLHSESSLEEECWSLDLVYIYIVITFKYLWIKLLYFINDNSVK